MIAGRRPIGLNHGEHCAPGDWEWLCDECREATRWDCDDQEEWDG